MNFYKHHIGDYDADTSHLSWLEDAAYRRLMSLYYRREAPIPADVAQACRLVRATSKAERAAVAAVLREFFLLTDDGWRQTRCDGEIEAAQNKADANRNNGILGGRPRKKGTQEKPIGFSVGSEAETQRNLSQTPDSRHQKPEKKNTPAAPADVDPQIWQDWTAVRKAKKAAVTQTAVAGIRAEAAKAGMSLNEALRVSCQQGWAGFKAEWLHRAGINGSKQAALETRNRAELDEFIRRGSDVAEAH